MTPYADPSSDEVEIYGKGNKNDDLSGDSGEDGGDDAYVILGEDYLHTNLEPNPSNNNPGKRKRQGIPEKRIGKANKLQHSLDRLKKVFLNVFFCNLVIKKVLLFIFIQIDL